MGTLDEKAAEQGLSQLKISCNFPKKEKQGKKGKLNCIKYMVLGGPLVKVASAKIKDKQRFRVKTSPVNYVTQ